MKKTYYDNTKLSCYKTCPRQFYFRHVRNWRREGNSAAISFGLSWHAAMDIIWGLAGKKSDDQVVALAYHKFLETWQEEGFKHPDDMDFDELEKLAPRTPMIAAEMLVHYLAKRKDFILNSEIVAIEQPFAIPLYPDDDCREFYIGRIDKVVRNNGRIFPIEHKTTSMYQGRAPDHRLKPDYIEQWSLNAQVDGYLNTTAMNYGKELKAIYVDAALVHKKTHNVFQFIPIERALTQMDAWLFDARDWVARVNFDMDRLREVRETDKAMEDITYLPAFPRNTESCQGKYNQTCSYFDLCRFWDNPEEHTLPEKFIEEEWNPFELLNIAEVEGQQDEG